jgi:hypothetical protein
MNISAVSVIDNGGRRSGIGRRQFSNSDHIPERRISKDRRSGSDRRSGMNRRRQMERRIGKVIGMKVDKRKKTEAGWSANQSLQPLSRFDLI